HFVTQPAAYHQVLTDRQLRKDPAVFRRKANATFGPFVRWKFGHIFVLEKDLAGSERQKSHDAFDRGRLAGSIAPNQAHHFPLVDVQGHAIQDVGGSAVGIDRLQFEHVDQSFRVTASGPEEPSRTMPTSSLFLISSDVPWARIAPCCMTTIRSEYLNTTTMSCSTITAVIPSPRTTEATVSMIWPLSRVLTPLVGSSRNRSFGFNA